MTISRAIMLLAVPVLALSNSACRFDCGTIGNTVASATVRDAGGAIVASVQVNLSDNVGPSFLRLSVGVLGVDGATGAPLRGHVTRARLVTGTGVLLADIPTDTTTLFANGVVALNRDLSRGEFDRVRGALLTHDTKVVLETDLAGREHIETTLANAQNVTGAVRRCTPT